MPIVNRIAEFHDEMTAWRRDIHAHPETAFEEVRTADLVAEAVVMTILFAFPEVTTWLPSLMT